MTGSSPRSSTGGGTAPPRQPGPELAAVVLATGPGAPLLLEPLCGRPMLLHTLGVLAAVPVPRILVVVGPDAAPLAGAVEAWDAGRRIAEVVAHPGSSDGAAHREGLRAALDHLDRRAGEGDPDGAGEPSEVVVLPAEVPTLHREDVVALLDRHRAGGGDATRLVGPATGGGPADAPPASIVVAGRGRLDAAVGGEASARRPAGDGADDPGAEVARSLAAAGVAVDVVEGAVGPVRCTDRAEVARAEAELRARVNEAWMRAGVRMTDPAHTYVDLGVDLAADVTLLPGTVLEGATVVGRGSVIGPNSRLVDCVVGEDATVEQVVARASEIGDRCAVGPFTHLRPGTRLGVAAKAGAFVEMKQAVLADGAKVPHLAYAGDAELGPGANFGAGTITANYDGRAKHRTVVGAGVRTGSNTVLVAPVTVGEGAVIGAGAVVTRDVPPGVVAKGVPARWENGPAASEPVREDEPGDAEGA